MSYASYAQFLVYGMPGVSLGTLTQAVVEESLQEASDEMDQHFGGRWKLPLASWPVELFARYCCWIAAYKLVTGARGFNPAQGSDANFKARYDSALEWLDKIQRRVLHPQVTEAPTASDGDLAQPVAVSSSVVNYYGQRAANRGW